MIRYYTIHPGLVDSSGVPIVHGIVINEDGLDVPGAEIVQVEVLGHLTFAIVEEHFSGLQCCKLTFEDESFGYYWINFGGVRDSGYTGPSLFACFNANVDDFYLRV